MADVLPFDNRDGSLWFDGKLIPWRDAKIHVLTHGLHYASSVFEGERMYSGRIYKLEEHTARLFKSAEILDMKIPYTQQQINDASYEAVNARDNPLLLGIFVVTAILVSLFNLITDIAYSIADPRVELGA